MPTIHFTHKGGDFTADWLNEERTALAVSTADVVEDENGVEHTEWPSDAKISRIVGKPVSFHDRGDSPDRSEAIFKACP